MRKPKRETDAVSSGWLAALNKIQKDIYGGTVPPATVTKRRAENKRARAARRANRSK